MKENDTNVSMPRIGDPAPQFKAVTTQGPINFPEDYKGNWVILLPAQSPLKHSFKPWKAAQKKRQGVPRRGPQPRL
jgi:hypothetical protein